MKHLDDRRRCPHCARDLNPRPYLMSRRATENVLSVTQIAWVLAAVLAFALLAQM